MLASPLSIMDQTGRKSSQTNHISLVSIQHAPSSNKLPTVHCMGYSPKRTGNRPEVSLRKYKRIEMTKHCTPVTGMKGIWMRNMKMYHPPKQPTSLARNSQGNIEGEWPSSEVLKTSVTPPCFWPWGLKDWYPQHSQPCTMLQICVSPREPKKVSQKSQRSHSSLVL